MTYDRSTHSGCGAGPGVSMTPRWPIAVGVLAAAIWGIALRGLLAGLWSVPGEYAHLRHAHSHGGVYLIVFPLCVLAWRELGVATVGRRIMVAYYLAGAASLGTFSVAGYSVFSIVASTIVAAVWLIAAYRGRAMLQAERGALRLMPISFVLVTAFVPPIALMTRRDPAFAAELAHSFLATLFLLVALPVALRRIGARPLDARLYVPAALFAALYLGAWPHAVASLGLLGAAITLGVTVWRSAIDLVYRFAWLGFAAGSTGLALVGPPSHHTTIGGLHYLLLGPLFISLVPLRRVPAWCTLAAAATMAASLVGLPWLGAMWGHTVAGVAGVGWVGAALGGLWAAWRPRD